MSSEYELWLRDVGVVVDAIEIGGEETLFILQQHFLAYPHAALFSLVFSFCFLFFFFLERKRERE